MRRVLWFEFVQSRQRLGEAEPALEPLLRPPPGDETTADRLAVELHVELDAEDAVAKRAVCLGHRDDAKRAPPAPASGTSLVTSLNLAPGSRIGELPDARSRVGATPFA